MNPPIAMIGCHRTSDDETFRDFSRNGTAFDELSIWTRKLEVNRTHNEVLYFTAGYGKNSFLKKRQKRPFGNVHVKALP